MKKQCPKCKKDKELSVFNKSKDRLDGLQVYCKECRNKIAQKLPTKEYQRKYRKSEKYKYCQKKYRIRNKTKLALKTKKHKEGLRLEALNKYGNKCECCDEKNTDFLVIDHIKGGGTKHRKKLNGGSGIFQWLRNKKYPKGFRTLCHNCNWSIYRNGGVCSHKGSSRNDTLVVVETKLASNHHNE